MNLACATARALNLRVGLLDADVFGPSVPILMNLAEAGMPAIDERKRMLPLENYGVKWICRWGSSSRRNGRRCGAGRW